MYSYTFKHSYNGNKYKNLGFFIGFQTFCRFAILPFFICVFLVIVNFYFTVRPISIQTLLDMLKEFSMSQPANVVLLCGVHRISTFILLIVIVLDKTQLKMISILFCCFQTYTRYFINILEYWLVALCNLATTV